MNKRASVAPLVLLCATAALAQTAQPAQQGERLTMSQCIQCHTLGRDEPHGAGPNLHAIFGRPAATAQGFKFSGAYVAAMKGKVWDARTMDQWLADTQAVAPGNGMTYFQQDARKRRQIIEYLATLK